jgi:hypothetical protein
LIIGVFGEWAGARRRYLAGVDEQFPNDSARSMSDDEQTLIIAKRHQAVNTRSGFDPRDLLLLDKNL